MKYIDVEGMRVVTNETNTLQNKSKVTQHCPRESVY